MAPIRPREGLDKCPHKVGIEDKSMHKQDRDIEYKSGKDRLVEGSSRVSSLNLESRGFIRNLGMRFWS